MLDWWSCMTNEESEWLIDLRDRKLPKKLKLFEETVTDKVLKTNEKMCKWQCKIKTKYILLQENKKLRLSDTTLTDCR